MEKYQLPTVASNPPKNKNGVIAKGASGAKFFIERVCSRQESSGKMVGVEQSI